MKFYFKKIILWLRNGKQRVITFEPNKVNIITGDSSTGKTELLDIIDYCFFSSTSKISESVINENIAWYGVLFNINGKNYTVARKALVKGRVTNEYYFSSIGDIPDEVCVNNAEYVIKKLLETEFSIDSNVAIPYGGNSIKLGSKISLRYFFMFNTISANIIENNTGDYFDNQHEVRYREALPRIFDLAVGIESIENILKKEEKLKLEKELNKLNRKKHSVSDKSNAFQNEQELIIKEAKEYSLIDSSLDFESSWQELKNIISGIKSEVKGKENNNAVEHNIYLIERKINNLKRFKTEYATYKRNLLDISDSLKPLSFLRDNDADIIKTSIFDDVINLFSSELTKIRDSCKNKTPIDKQVNDEIKSLEIDLIKQRGKFAIFPKVSKSFDNDNSKYFFLGEVKSKVELYSSTEESLAITINDNVADLEKKIGALHIENTLDKRDLIISLIEEIISEYIAVTGDALVNYAGYKPVFKYDKKSLLLRKPKTNYIENVGSSSNHMFLHLFFSLAMQEIVFQNKSPFVAPYLIIDQPSRPYYGSGDKRKQNIDQSDEFKITKAFELLNDFIATRIKNGGDFQMIVFEHIPSKIFKDMQHVHLVEEFYNGNALIPVAMLEN